MGWDGASLSSLQATPTRLNATDMARTLTQLEEFCTFMEGATLVRRAFTS
jgi:hypothetical protein